jgi:hypothetical protein
MRLGIMQPYFFPYPGHFALIASVDEWIVFDVTQYTPKTWMNRNRILHPKQGWQYISVPLSNSSTSIKTHEAKLVSLADSESEVLGKLTAFRRHAPFYRQVTELVRMAFANAPGDSLCMLNVSALRVVCEYIGLPFKARVCSELDLDYPETMGPGDWAPFICESLGASSYVNPISGQNLFDPARFRRSGIELLFAEFGELRFDPSPFTFEPHLSILDALLWLPPDDIARALRDNTTLIAA